jgi:hypothetical protein
MMVNIDHSRRTASRPRMVNFAAVAAAANRYCLCMGWTRGQAAEKRRIRT